MKVCKDSSATFLSVNLVVVYLLVTSDVGEAVPEKVGNPTTLMEYYIISADCWAMVGEGPSGGLQSLFNGLEKLLPISQRTRCFAYCFLKKAGIIRDKLGFNWNDNQLTLLVNHIIKDKQNRGNYVIRSYLRCKHFLPAVLGPSRCNNTLLFLVCLRSLGVSFLLTDECANHEQSKFMAQSSADDEMSKRLYEVNQLEMRFEKTTLKLTPDVTVLQGFRAETFWNAFDGDPKPIGALQDDCPIPKEVNKTLRRYLGSQKEGPQRQYFDILHHKDEILAFSEYPPKNDVKFGVDDYIEVVEGTTLQNDIGIFNETEETPNQIEGTNEANKESK
ncbi:hypothetical protein GE061_006910 [Apolygus lucorum]|uniref:Uncharacterized protein n=1 Tax=Apolygus lucorum TaxID=248454 RepID=A0A8S9WQF7_APOLU|nr:hypothetical protein GE061_006910 [Apolygus lucorum]